MRRAIWAILLLIGLLAGMALWVLAPQPSAPHAPLPGLDTGTTATAMLTWDRTLLADWGRTQPWLRIRGHPMAKDRPEVVMREALALRELSSTGFKPVILLRWGEKTWTHGIRPGVGYRLPLDLREAYQRGFTEGRRFGATGAAFEIDNEPDISFVHDNAETYLAYLKAMYLGVKAGAAVATSFRHSTLNIQRPSSEPGAVPRVVMAPLALPPGPYFERMVENGLFSYTDAFNYHYYGYAEDFAGVYEQFENAVSEFGSVGLPLGARQVAGTEGTDQGPALHSRERSLPVLLTEYGYGALGKDARNTVDGRVRQWRWFKAVGEDIARLRIAGPMAFYLPPYLEVDHVEFGVTMPVSKLPAFTPADFGAVEAAPWMQRIGQRFGANEATPALAWLMDEGARRAYEPRDWSVKAPPPSSVVIDFIAGHGLAQAKRYGGYVAQRIAPQAPLLAAATPGPPRSVKRPTLGEAPPPPPPLPSPGLPPGHVPPSAWFGTGAVVLYNFSDRSVQGRLQIERGRDQVMHPASLEREWVLGPQSRTVVEIDVRVPSNRFARLDFALRFEPVATSADNAPAAVLRTAFFPNFPLLREMMVHDFTAPTNGRNLLDYPTVRATEEPPREPQGRWLVTKGVRVEETAPRLWRFHIDRFPDEPEKSAMAELPLPSDFQFPPGALLRFYYRLAQPAGTTLDTGKYMEAYFRTANGNLYQVWPRQLAVHAWSDYTEAKENFTMAFHSRAQLPWRFRDNQPVALVFFFRPRNALPAIYEVKDARIVELGQ